jgi:hypothetical protein
LPCFAVNSEIFILVHGLSYIRYQDSPLLNLSTFNHSLQHC